jgi:hypothetical protein
VDAGTDLILDDRADRGLELAHVLEQRHEVILLRFLIAGSAVPHDRTARDAVRAMPHRIRRIALDGPDDVGRYLDLSDEPDVPDVVSLLGKNAMSPGRTRLRHRELGSLAKPLDVLPRTPASSEATVSRMYRSSTDADELAG